MTRSKKGVSFQQHPVGKPPGENHESFVEKTQIGARLKALLSKPDGMEVLRKALTGEQIRSLWSGYTRAKQQVHAGPTLWKKHNPKARTRCRCKKCDARRKAREASTNQQPPADAEASPPIPVPTQRNVQEPTRPPRDSQTGPLVVRSRYMGR